MKAYVITSGVIFGLLTIAHLVRIAGERHLLTDAAFVFITLVSAGLSVWAWRLLRSFKQ